MTGKYENDFSVSVRQHYLFDANVMPSIFKSENEYKYNETSYLHRKEGTKSFTSIH